MDLEIFSRVLAAYTMAAHVLFTYWAISLPIFIVAAEFLAYRRNDPYYMAIAKRWSVVMAVLFAVGSAAGAAIAVEFITVWYKWMYVVNEVDILPFDIEVLAFFTEVIFLALYLYGWDRMSRNAHMVIGLLVALGSTASAILIIMVNSWMNTPTGFDAAYFAQTGQLKDVDPLAALAAPAALAEVPMGVAGAWFVGFGSVLGYFAYRLLTKKDMTKDEKEYYTRGFRLAAYLWALDAIFLAWAGDNAGKVLYSDQPLKLATLEGLMTTGPNAPVEMFGVSVPGLLSLLVSWPPDPNAVVLGYSSFVQEAWNPIWELAHMSYDVHATLGIIGALVAWLLAYSLWKRPKALSFLGLDNPEEKKLPLLAAFFIGWLQLVAWEAGWVAAETGRQPWVIWGPMVQTATGLYAIQAALPTAEAYSTNPEVVPIGVTIMAVLAIAVAGTVLMLKRMFRGRNVSVDVSESATLVSVSGGGVISATPGTNLPSAQAANPSGSPSGDKKLVG